MSRDRPPDCLFSSSYQEARDRFRASARSAGAHVRAYPVADDDLTIDVAMLGADDRPTLVVSSGVHGVEGFFGSAVQLAVLQDPPPGHADIRVVLIHAVNPVGFAATRRFNEENVDLNRNFLLSCEAYRGAPPGYAELYPLLNPESPPTRFEPFLLKAGWRIVRGGLQPLKEAVARGQYEFPRGLFYGGSGPCRSTQLIQENCGEWLKSAQDILHVDFHTGLGRYSKYKLLINEPDDTYWYDQAFGKRHVESLIQPGGTAYPVSGLFGAWMQRKFADRDYRFVGAEFGTYRVIRVLASIRAENRAHHYCPPQSSAYQRAKRELLECFCPRSPSWRRAVLQSGRQILQQAARALTAK